MQQIFIKPASGDRKWYTGSFIALIILGFGIAGSIYGAYISHQILKSRALTIFEEQTQEILSAITHRMENYEQVLRGGQGLFAASEEVEREEWRIFVESQNIQERFPGIQGIGYSMKVGSAADREQHVAELRAQEFPDFSHRPAGEREEYHSIIYLEPFDTRNQQAFGYDMFSEANRRAAMQRARDSGEAAVSGRVTLVQEIDEDVQSGFLMYLPVYENDTSQETLQDRRTNLQGFVYSPFRMNDLMKGVVGLSTSDVDFRIYDESIVPENLMYDESAVLGLEHPLHSRFRIEKDLSLYGRTWHIEFSSRDLGNFGHPEWEPSAILIMGIIISLLLFWSIRNARKGKVLAEIKAQEITKDLQKSEEQLRFFVEHTPAAVAMFDTKMRYILLSKRWKEDYGLDDKEILGKSHYTVFPKIPKRWKAIHKSALEGNVQKCAEDSFIRPDGKKEWLRWEIYPWYTSSKKVGGIIMFTEIITERKKHQQELEERTSELERLNETMINREMKMIELKKENTTLRKNTSS